MSLHFNSYSGEFELMTVAQTRFDWFMEFDEVLLTEINNRTKRREQSKIRLYVCAG